MSGLIGGQYKPLSEKNIVKIHETSLRILEEIGVKVALEEALQILGNTGQGSMERSSAFRLRSWKKDWSLFPINF